MTKRFCVRAARAGLAAAIVAIVLATVPARTEQLVADLSRNEIKITTGFSGTTLLLFGVTDGPGDVIVIVSGPDSTVTVRKKDRVSGLWINTESVQFDGVPAYYHVAASNRLSQSELIEVLRENGVGFQYQNMVPTDAASPEQTTEFREALLRRKQVARLYSPLTGRIEFVGGSLFRTLVPFPATVPTGDYRVEVYQVTDDWVRSSTTIPLRIAKVGAEEAIFRFAHEHPALYGVFAIVVAALAGYGAGMVFGRR